jgi:hypothetical protein
MMTDAQSTIAPLSIAQQLYTDALLSIFAFLDFHPSYVDEEVESVPLLAAILTCKAWYRAALKEKSRGCGFNPKSTDELLSLCNSLLRVHVNHLTIGFDFSWSDLSRIRLCLPHLNFISVGLDHVLTKDDSANLFLTEGLPPFLTEMSMKVSPKGVALMQSLIDVLPMSSQLTRLNLILPSQRDDMDNAFSQLDLSPLLQLGNLIRFSWSASLDEFHYHGAVAGHPMSQTQLGILKQIPSLRNLFCNFGEWIEEEMCHAFMPPHRLQLLQFVELKYTEVNAAMLSYLASLPALMELKPMRLLPEAYPLLSRFPQLRILNLSFLYPQPTVDELVNLCVALQSCSLLRAVYVKSVGSKDLLSGFLLQLLRGRVHPVLALEPLPSLSTEEKGALQLLETKWNDRWTAKRR